MPEKNSNLKSSIAHRRDDDRAAQGTQSARKKPRASTSDAPHTLDRFGWTLAREDDKPNPPASK